MILRWIGLILLAAALLVAAWEIGRWAISGSYMMLSAGELWFAIHRGSLNAAQAGIQRYVAAWLWDPVITWILIQPAWAVLGVPGLLFYWIGRPRARSRSIFRTGN